MNVSNIIAQGRIWLVDSTQYTDDEAIVHFNLVYSDVISDIITKVDEDYYWDKVTDSLVQWQTEYRIEEIVVSPTNYKINEINKVFVKYNSSATYHTKARRINPASLEFDFDWYATNQSTSDPIYYVQDNSVFIAPAPTANVTWWIKIEVIYQPPELAKTDSEASILIPRRFHRVLIAWMKIHASESRWIQFLWATQTFQALYDKEKMDMITQLRARNQDIIQVQEPNLTNLC